MKIYEDKNWKFGKFNMVMSDNTDFSVDAILWGGFAICDAIGFDYHDANLYSVSSVSTGLLVGLFYDVDGAKSAAEAVKEFYHDWSFEGVQKLSLSPSKKRYAIAEIMNSFGRLQTPGCHNKANPNEIRNVEIKTCKA